MTGPLAPLWRGRRCGLVAGVALLLAGCSGPPAHHPAPRTTARWINPTPEQRQCLASLGQAQTQFSPLPDQYFGAGCATINTVQLAWLRSDHAQLHVVNIGPVTCALATTLQGWARFGVDRAARAALGSPLARIDTYGSYNCRNVAGTERRSAHATANAVDIAAFTLADGRRISIKGGWSDGSAAERTFLRLVRDSACKRFSVVLTPDYNGAHRDHLHLEVGAPHPLCK